MDGRNVPSKAMAQFECQSDGQGDSRQSYLVSPAVFVVIPMRLGNRLYALVLAVDMHLLSLDPYQLLNVHLICLTERSFPTHLVDLD